MSAPRQPDSHPDPAPEPGARGGGGAGGSGEGAGGTGSGRGGRGGDGGGGGATIEVAPGVHAPAQSLRFTYTTSRGPGGQNVNRRATRAELRVAVDDLGLSQRVRGRLETLAGSKLTDGGELLIASEEKRSQRQNREICMQRLRELIVRARALPKPRKPTRPSRGAVERRIREKKQRGEIKRRRKPPEGGT